MLNFKMLIVGLGLLAGLAWLAANFQSILHSIPVAFASSILEVNAQTGETPPNLPVPSAPQIRAAPTARAQPNPTLVPPFAFLSPQQPPVPDAVAIRSLASFYYVSVEGISAWHDRGFSYDDIIRGYTLARLSGKSPKEIFPTRSSGVTWDQIEVMLCGKTGHPIPTLQDIVNGKARRPKAEECKPED